MPGSESIFRDSLVGRTLKFLEMCRSSRTRCLDGRLVSGSVFIFRDTLDERRVKFRKLGPSSATYCSDEGLISGNLSTFRDRCLDISAFRDEVIGRRVKFLEVGR